MFHLCVICHRTARRSIALASAGLLACSMIAIQTYGQELDRALDAPERAAVIDGLLAKVLKIYVLPDVAQQMERAIRDRQANKEYDTVSSGQELARVLTRHLRDVSKDDHLRVDFFARGIPYDSEKKPDPKVVEEFRQGGLRRNYEFKKVERLEGGIGLLQVDGFYPAEWITETAAGAMAFLANSESYHPGPPAEQRRPIGRGVAVQLLLQGGNPLDGFLQSTGEHDASDLELPGRRGRQVRGQGPVHSDQPPDVLGGRGTRL